MICKRCEVMQVKPERMINGYCRHCQGAIRKKVRIIETDTEYIIQEVKNGS